jgi:4-aminobutyrate aminotransferase/(S)-3-amino-2-methylpropionate transaminase
MDQVRQWYDAYVAHRFAAIEPLVVARAEGTRLWDQEGREYLDCFSGISVVNLGHRHPAVIAAVQTQLERLVHCNSYTYYVPEVALLARRLAEITPGRLQKSFFSNSGAEAVEAAMRMAKAYTGRSEFIALERGFHGRTLGTLGLTGNAGRRRKGGPYVPGVAFAPCPVRLASRPDETPAQVVERAVEGLENAFRYQTSGAVAAVIVEPVLGEGGIVVPPREYLPRVREVADRYQALLIVDEVQTGFGRTGRMFAIEHYGVEPDIMTLAKGIADGFPLGATVAREEIADSLGPGEHLSTFGGNPVSVAAALANLEEIIRLDLPAAAARMGEMALSGLVRWAQGCAGVREVRGLGLMIGIELADVSGPRPDWAAAARAHARQAGVLIGVGGPEGNVLRLQPPLVISEADWLRALEVVESAVAAAVGA